MGIFMLPDLPEASYLSRFFTKFVEIAAGGLATAMCAYLIAYLQIPLAPTTPAAVSAGPSVATSSPAQPAPPVAAAPPVVAVVVDEQRRVPQPVTDAPAQPVHKAEKAAMTAPAPKDIKTGSSVARSEKSVETLARAALANVDADRPAAADVPLRRNLTGSATAAQRLTDVPPHPIDIPPPVAVEVPRRVAAIAPLPPNASSPPEIAAPQQEPPADEVRGLFSVPKRILGLLRLGTPSFAGEAPRPPMPVGTPE
jgi:hypothetical protein